VLVIVIVIAVHHVVLVDRCCPATTTTPGSEAATATQDSGQQPPYVAELRLLNGSGKRVKLEEVKVNLDPMNKGSTDPTQPGWEPIHDDFDPPLSEWLDDGLVHYAINAATPDKVYGVYVKAVFEGGGGYERIVSGLLGLKDTSVTVVAETAELECPPPPGGDPLMVEQERILLCVAEGISATGLAGHKWDED
jgi:hypothetical protein